MSPEEALQALVLDDDLERLEDLLAEFNLFDVLKIERRELQHSALLAWLLNPRGSHGLRDYFLRRFLAAAAAEASDRGIAEVTPLDVDGWELANIEVANERHHIDILLIGGTDGFVCLIENKVGAEEHSGQLGRYLETVEREYEGLNPFPIFLTPDGVEPETQVDAERYVPLDYGTVADLIERTLRTRGSTIGASVVGFLEQYARTLRRHVLNTTDNIDELALQIYDNHRAAIDLIINARPAMEERGWAVIDSAIEKHAPRLQAESLGKSIHRFYAPELDEIPELQEGTGWTKSGRLLLFELKLRERVLVLMLGPGPEQTRQRLHELVEGDGVPGVDMRRARKLSPRWHTLYSRTLVGPDGSREPNYEKARAQVEQVIAGFFDDDYWPMVNAVRAEFGLPPVSASSAHSAKLGS